MHPQHHTYVPFTLRLALGFAVMALCLTFSGLTARAEGPLRVALLLETPTGDHDWNDSLAAGLEQAHNEFGVRAAVIVAPAGHDDNALQEMFRNAAQNNDLVLVASDGLHEILRNNAANFRRTMFGCIDAGVRAPNIMSVTFADEQAAYLAGAAAAMTALQTSLPGISGKKIIGWISGQDTPAMQSNKELTMRVVNCFQISIFVLLITASPVRSRYGEQL